jgi:hypothetical protein
VTVTYTPSACGASDSATLNASGVKAGATAQETLTGAGAGIQGVVEAIQAPNFTVAGTTVITDANTLWGGGLASFADLRTGDHVSVCGSVNADGSVRASSVTGLVA